MRFGAHVSSSGGISKAIGRGRDLGCESLQVFTHNPRTWRPINHSDEEIAAFRARRGRRRASARSSATASTSSTSARPTARCRPARRASRRRRRATSTASSVESLVQHLDDRASGSGWRASCCTSARSRARPRTRRSRASAPGSPRRSTAAPGDCCVFLENTAGAGDTIGRTFAQLRAVADAVGVPERLAFCLDSQHLFASGYPIHEDGGIDRVLADFDEHDRHRAPALPAPERLQGRLRLEPRPPREHRRRRDRRGGAAAASSATRDLQGLPGDPGGPRAWTAAAPTWRTWPAPAACTRRAWAHGRPEGLAPGAAGGENRPDGTDQP